MIVSKENSVCLGTPQFRLLNSNVSLVVATGKNAVCVCVSSAAKKRKVENEITKKEGEKKMFHC